MSAEFHVTDPGDLLGAGNDGAKRVAEALLDRVRALTPTGPSIDFDPSKAVLADSWELVWDLPSWVVQNGVPYARAVEFGGVFTPNPAAMMGQAVAEVKARYGLR